MGTIGNLAAIGLSTIALLGTVSRPVFAQQPMIQRVNTPLDRVMNINIHPGIGTSLNFEQLGETIETMFLENKSFVGLTTNGSSTVKASLVHLSLIDRLNIPGVVNVNQQTNQSGLTIITRDKSGQRNTYVFNLRRAKNSDVAVALVDFTLPPPPAPVPRDPSSDILILKQQIDRNNHQRQEVVAKLVAGLKIANTQGDLRNYTPAQFDAIKKMVIAIHQGRTLMESAERYSVDLGLVTKLILLGS